MIGYSAKKHIYTAPTFEVFEEVFERDGSSHTHANVYRKPIVSILPVTSSGEIYLIYQERMLLGKISLEGIAGHVEDGEEIELAAKRELKEETGLTAKIWKKLATMESSASVVKSEVHVFLATDLTTGEAEPDEGEVISLVKMPIAEAVKRVLDGEINTETSMIGILLLDKMRQAGKL